MKVRLLADLPTPDGIIFSGRVVDVPDHLIDRLYGKVEVLPRHRQDVPQDWRPKPKIWLQDGELRTAGLINDLASEIVKLTFNDMALQRRLLETYCQIYGPAHFWILEKQWNKRAAILEHETGISREEAEIITAEICHLTAYLEVLH